MCVPVADLSIRPATPDDLPALRELWLAFETYLKTIGAQDPIDPARFDGFRDLAFGTQPLCMVLLAEREGRAVGYLVYHIGVWMDDMAPALARSSRPRCSSPTSMSMNAAKASAVR